MTAGRFDTCGHGLGLGLSGGFGQGLVKVGNQIVNILGSDGQPQYIWPGLRGGLLFRGKLPVRGRGGVNDQ